ncbi:MAG: hypothetical protein M3340_15040 [Actinomycetota bacterium]|nr:hypothetical protein [Actinomycetota bacterium]
MGERGQASIEWVCAVLLVTVVLGAAGAGLGDVDGRSYGGWLAHTLVCAVRGGCEQQRDALARAYGERDAELVRRYAPNLVYERGTLTLPVDFRTCRSHRCSDAPDDRDLDAHRTTRGAHPATAFTHVVHRDGETFIQYWLYYPDSTSTVANAAGIWNKLDRTRWSTMPGYPGYHPDDWESVQVRVAPDGRVRTRASSHHGYQWCKQRRCKNDWGPWTGWSRVFRGSHAGHIPERLERERTTTSAGLRLVPIESLDTDAYEPLDEGITPPWRKKVYSDPLSDSTS